MGTIRVVLGERRKHKEGRYPIAITYEKGRISESLGKIADVCHCYGKAFQYGVFEARNCLDTNYAVDQVGREKH